MITSFFRKSALINYAFLVLALIIFYFIFQIRQPQWGNSFVNYGQNIGKLALLFGAVFTTDFIARKNGLSKGSAYNVLTYVLLLLFFPSVFNNTKLLMANFFILLALRRVISMQSLKLTKEKIFDASLWIFIAALFHFWSIAFIFLVFISVFFHVARDYRNWILPFLAFIAVGVLFLLFVTITNSPAIETLIKNSATNFSIDYFSNKYQNISFSIYVTIGLFFLMTLLISFPKQPLMTLSSYKKLTTAFIIGAIVFSLSDQKSNELLIFTCAPISIMATNYLETVKTKVQSDFILLIVISCSLFVFFHQL
jgi:hypothetical protein